jgi:hypothetical protein
MPYESGTVTSWETIEAIEGMQIPEASKRKISKGTPKVAASLMCGHVTSKVT